MATNVDESKNLYVFGDSWPWGEELNQPAEVPFGHIVAKQLNLEYKLFADTATSIPHIVLQLLTCLESHDPSRTAYAIVFLTDYNRDIVYEDVGPPLKASPSDKSAHSIYYYKYVHNERMSGYKANTTLLALQKMFEDANIKPVFLWGWTTPPIWDIIDQTYFYPCTCAQMFDHTFNGMNNTIGDLAQCKYIAPLQGHPNQLGHKLIADNLVKFLQEKFDCFR